MAQAVHALNQELKGEKLGQKRMVQTAIRRLLEGIDSLIWCLFEYSCQ